MTRFVLEAGVSDPNGDNNRTISKVFKDQDEAIEKYNEALKLFNKGLPQIREIFGFAWDDFSFYFRGVPKLYKENIMREEYKP